MNIDRLKYFAAVVETRNLRKASELVGIAPGSMSKAISVLEAELGIKLIRPEGRGIEITAEGHRIFRSLTPLLGEYHRFLKNCRDKASQHDRSKLKIGTFEVFSTYFASALLEKEFATQGAMMLELTPGDIEKAIEENLVDYGITYLPSPNVKLNFVEVGTFEMGIFGLQKWEQESFLKWPFAIPVTPLTIQTLEHASLDMWPRTKSRLVKYEFELLESALQTTRSGLSVIHCPDLIVSLHNRYVMPHHRLVKLPYPSGIQIDKKIKIYLVALKDNPGIKLIEGKVAKFLRTSVASQPSQPKHTRLLPRVLR